MTALPRADIPRIMSSEAQQEMLEGILVVDKPVGKSSFALVDRVRRITKVQRVGHSGTLDPFASGVLVLLLGRTFTRMSEHFMGQPKVYWARLELGVSTDTYDCTGQVQKRSDFVPSLQDITREMHRLNRCRHQVPPMFSAKSIGGQRLYTLARRGEVIERAPVPVDILSALIAYRYPYVDLRIISGKGAYMRSLAHDLGNHLGCGAHLTQLIREKSGRFSRFEALDGALLFTENSLDLRSYVKGGSRGAPVRAP